MYIYIYIYMFGLLRRVFVLVVPVRVPVRVPVSGYLLTAVRDDLLHIIMEDIKEVWDVCKVIYSHLRL